MKLTTEDLKRIRRPGVFASAFGHMAAQLTSLTVRVRCVRVAPCGERNPNCRLSDAQVAAIRDLQGVESAGRVATLHGISKMHVTRIWRGLARMP